MKRFAIVLLLAGFAFGQAQKINVNSLRLSDDGTTLTYTGSGGFSTNPGSGEAGFVACGQGTAHSIESNTVGWTCGTSITGFNFVAPSAAGSGWLKGANSSNTVTLSFDTSPATVSDCGTTTTCTNTAVSSPRILTGVVTLSTGSAVVSSISPAWTSTSSFVCVGTDRTATNGVSIANTSTSSITITGTGSDVIGYHCIGN